MTNTFRTFENRLDKRMTIIAARDTAQKAELEKLIYCNPHTQVWPTKAGSMSIPSFQATNVINFLNEMGWREA